MSLMRGRHLEDFLAQRPSQKLRNQLGAHLFELFYFQLLKVEAFHADPHWGNYLFNDDAGISLVDFGCVKHLRPESVAYLRSIFLYPGATDSADFRRLLERYYEGIGEKLLPSARRALIGFADNFYRKVYPPEPEKQLPVRFRRLRISARLSARIEKSFPHQRRVDRFHLYGTRRDGAVSNITPVEITGANEPDCQEISVNLKSEANSVRRRLRQSIS